MARFKRLLAAAILLAAAQLSLAGEYPARPIKMVVPYGAGGTIDLIARMLSPRLNELLGQPVVVENRPGGGTTIGAAQVARAAPDGYTVFLGSNAAFTISPQIMKVPYDPVASLTAVGMVSSFPNLILVKPDSPLKSLDDAVRAARAQPDKLSYASFGIGSTAQLSGEAIKVAADLQIAEVPYKSGAECVQAVLGGEVAFGFDTVIGSVQRVKQGQVRALAVTSAQRHPDLPQVPSVVEAGFPGAEVTAWIALFVPANTPPDVQRKLAQALQQALADARTQQKLAGLGVEVAKLDGPATMSLLRQEYVRFGKLVEKAHIRAQ
ncbi:MAG: tripartite tricarboxylate transporter substrate binding protein [Desulfovibrionaceae bacterium]|nr:tripartite tricarboxylate transporter substrate binding protein [Desulfovibrionaceae bacterium]